MIEVEMFVTAHKTLYFIKGTKTLHREDGPARIDGERREWFLNGVRHREDGPAIIFGDGREEWYRNGDLHREDGPAVIFSDGSFGWSLNDFFLSTKEEWFEALAEEQKVKAFYSEYFIRG